MAKQPSVYEERAWLALALHAPRRRSSRAAASAARKLEDFTRNTGGAANTLLEKSPTAVRIRRAARTAAATTSDKIPATVKTQTTRAGHTVRKVGEGAMRGVSRGATSTLSPDRVVRAHKKRNHPVEKLHDLHDLDLALIDVVKPRSLDLQYSAAAAVVGGSTGFVVTGSTIAITVSAGAAAAPGVGTIATAMAADAGAILGIASRAVGHVALYYGYDPTHPDEKLFLMSVVNLGSAMTASAKTFAFGDVSKLTQLLMRGGTWAKLNETITARLASAFAKQFTVRLTQRGLGKLVPAVGVVAGASLDWLTVEQIVDAADMAYRRRFLLDKYPHLGDDRPDPLDAGPQDDGPDFDAADGDLDISIVEMLRSEGALPLDDNMSAPSSPDEGAADS